MSGHCSRASWRAEVALAAPTWADAVGRRRLALGLPGVARGGLARSGEKGSAWRGSAVWAKTVGASVSARCACVPNVRSARALGVHGTCST